MGGLLGDYGIRTGSVRSFFFPLLSNRSDHILGLAIRNVEFDRYPFRRIWRNHHLLRCEYSWIDLLEPVSVSVSDRNFYYLVTYVEFENSFIFANIDLVTLGSISTDQY